MATNDKTTLTEKQIFTRNLCNTVLPNHDRIWKRIIDEDGGLTGDFYNGEALELSRNVIRLMVEEFYDYIQSDMRLKMMLAPVLIILRKGE